MFTFGIGREAVNTLLELKMEMQTMEFQIALTLEQYSEHVLGL